jgi:hypothetical protein
MAAIQFVKLSLNVRGVFNSRIPNSNSSPLSPIQVQGWRTSHGCPMQRILHAFPCTVWTLIAMTATSTWTANDERITSSRMSLRKLRLLSISFMSLSPVRRSIPLEHPGSRTAVTVSANDSNRMDDSFFQNLAASYMGDSIELSLSSLSPSLSDIAPRESRGSQESIRQSSRKGSRNLEARLPKHGQ